MDKKQQLEKLNKEILSCSKCKLRDGCKQVVPGEGSANSKIMLIGEGPGAKEDELGQPFVGAAGKFLDEMLSVAKFERKDVYIANVVKCRPPNNRDPEQDEVDACWTWLEKQIDLIRPKVIVPLGRHSLARFLPSAKISQDHGRALRKNFEKIGRVVFFPCYHPAAALYNGGLRSTLLSDFKKIPKILEIMEKEDKSEKDPAKEDRSENKNEDTPKQSVLFKH